MFGFFVVVVFWSDSLRIGLPLDAFRNDIGYYLTLTSLLLFLYRTFMLGLGIITQCYTHCSANCSPSAGRVGGVQSLGTTGQL